MQKLVAALALAAALVLSACAEVGYLHEKTRVDLLTGNSLYGLKLTEVDRGVTRRVAVPGLKDFSASGFLVENRIIAAVYSNSPGDHGLNVYAVPLNLAPPRLLGFADRAFPSLTPGYVWLESKRRKGDGWEDILREVNLRGKQIGSYKIPPERELVAPVEGGFLTYLFNNDEDEASGARTYGYGSYGESYLEVWDPLTDKTVRRIDIDAAVIATGRRIVAMHRIDPVPGNARAPGGPGDNRAPAPCGTRCPIHLVDVRTGHDKEIPLLGGIEGVQAEGLFSPDGRSLAVTVENLQQDGSFFGNLFVIGVDSGQIHRVANAGNVEYLGSWSPDGKWLFFAHFQEIWDPARIGAYRLGSDRAKVIWPNIAQSHPLLAIPDLDGF